MNILNGLIGIKYNFKSTHIFDFSMIESDFFMCKLRKQQNNNKRKMMICSANRFSFELIECNSIHAISCLELLNKNVPTTLNEKKIK